MTHVQTLKEETNESFKEKQENANKQVKETNKNVED